MAYACSLFLGGLGFALIPFVPNQYAQIVPFLLIGCAWAAMLAMPFTFVTNALQGYGHMGAYLGLFNGTICLPQIIAAICGGSILHIVVACGYVFVALRLRRNKDIATFWTIFFNMFLRRHHLLCEQRACKAIFLLKRL